MTRSGGHFGAARRLNRWIVGGLLFSLVLPLGGCGNDQPPPDTMPPGISEASAAALRDLVETQQSMAFADELLQFDPLLDCTRTPEENAQLVAAAAQLKLLGCGRLMVTGSSVTLTAIAAGGPGVDLGAACQFGFVQLSGSVTLDIQKRGASLILTLDLSRLVINGIAATGVWTLETRDCTLFQAMAGPALGGGPAAAVNATIAGQPGKFSVSGTMTTTSTSPATTSSLSNLLYRPGDCYPSGGQLTAVHAGARQTIEFNEQTAQSGVGVLLPSGVNVPLTPYGRCPAPCSGGKEDCDGDRRNGCERDVHSDVLNCGFCNVVCAPPNAFPRCSLGACQIRDCMNGFANCDKLSNNGCEVDIYNDVRNCKSCGTVCSVANGTPTCSLATCKVASCNPGFGDCDEAYPNGCETRLSDDVNNCGRCGNVCRPGANAGAATCTAGQCGSRCAEGFADCDGNAGNGCETATSSSASNCGGCGVVCPVQANAMAATCAAGVCGNACRPGFGDCDGQVMNGCETPTSSDVNHCGTCNSRCALQNALPACRMGACAVASCLPGFGDCDGLPGNGCELATSNNVNHCGMCGRACMLANAMPSCAAGACGIASCNAGFGDCDGQAGNGCEKALVGDASNCGACGRVCAVPNAVPACPMGTCTVGSCRPGFDNCDGQVGNGCETQLLSDVMNCGACGQTCMPGNATPSCSGGQCAIANCNAGFADCDIDPHNGCEVRLDDNPRHCGRCNQPCNLANAVPACASGVCTISMCNVGFKNCDGVHANGCEQNVTNDVMNCGNCGVVCPDANLGARCVNSVCVAPTCNDGIKNGLETDVDCGGMCPNACADGKACTVDHDCRSGYCRAGGRCFSGHELVGRWKLDEGMGGTAADSSGKGNHGTLRPAPGMPSPWSARGGVGMTPALTFNRTNDVAVNPSGSLDNLGSHLSLSAWVNPTLLVVFDTVLMKSNGNWGSGYGIYAQNANEICAFANGWGNHICAPIFPDGHLHHVVLTYDGTTLALYIDNIESTTPVAYVASLSADTLYIGYGNGQNHTWSFEGVIDEVRVYDGTLTAQEVATLYNTPNGNGP